LGELHRFLTDARTQTSRTSDQWPAPPRHVSVTVRRNEAVAPDGPLGRAHVERSASIVRLRSSG
jgi:hypothetical protein